MVCRILSAHMCSWQDLTLTIINIVAYSLAAMFRLMRNTTTQCNLEPPVLLPSAPLEITRAATISWASLPVISSSAIDGWSSQSHRMWLIVLTPLDARARPIGISPLCGGMAAPSLFLIPLMITSLTQTMPPPTLTAPVVLMMTYLL